MLRDGLEGWDGEMGGRFKREGKYVYRWLIHGDVWQQPTQYCKAIIPQLITNKCNKSKKEGGDICIVIQLLSCVQLLVTPWTAAHQASLFFTISRYLLKLMSVESVMPPNHLVLCRLLVLMANSRCSMAETNTTL